MRKSIVSLLLFTMICTLIVGVPREVQASEVEETEVGDSGFTDEEESSATVYAYLTTTLRGVYLLQGSAMITRPFTGIAGCSGSTTANYAVSVIGVTITLEKYVNGSWTTVTGWSTVEYNDYYVNSYKGISVTGGYYYRVSTSHVAGTDTAMTATSGIWFT